MTTLTYTDIEDLKQRVQDAAIIGNGDSFVLPDMVYSDSDILKDITLQEDNQGEIAIARPT